MLERIKELCHDRGMNIRTLEKAVGIGNGVIGSWDKVSPRLDNVRKVADYFGVSIDELVKGKPEAGA